MPLVSFLIPADVLEPDPIEPVLITLLIVDELLLVIVIILPALFSVLILASVFVILDI